MWVHRQKTAAAADVFSAGVVAAVPTEAAEAAKAAEVKAKHAEDALPTAFSLT